MTKPGIVLNNRYRLEKKIGEGGFAQVYLATDVELERQVAIKVLDQNWAKDAEFLGRFRKEARAVARLEHPNILPIYDFGVAEDTAYLVMPYIGGGTFSARMKQTRLTLDEIAFFLEQIGEALDYAHQQGVIHRDIKPGNVLIRLDGRLVLTDFGLAKLLDNVSTEAPTGVLGTVAYMAPEQFRGMVSSSSDVYALGVLTYQMLSGKLPFEGSTREILLGHVYNPPRPLSSYPAMQQFDPAITQALDNTLAKVLAKQPAERFPNCQAFAYAYRAAIRRPKTTRAPELPDDATELDPQRLQQVQAVPALPSFPNSIPGIPATPPPIPMLPVELLPPRPAPKKMVMLQPARLSVSTEPDQGYQAVFELYGDNLTLGREADNKLHLPLPIVSRHHAVLQKLSDNPQGPHYKIVDLKSINHLYFRQQEVPEKILQDGDIIEIGMRGFGQFIVILTYHAPVFGEI